MSNIGQRIKVAQARVEAMQQQIQTILKEKEVEDRCSKCNHRCNEDCAHPELTDADYDLEITVRELLHMIADDGYTFLYNGSILSIINTPQWFIEKGDAYGYTEELDTLVEDYYLTKERNGSFVWNIVTIITDEDLPF